MFSFVIELYPSPFFRSNNLPFPFVRARVFVYYRTTLTPRARSIKMFIVYVKTSIVGRYE